jgi:hypothetical protein
MINETHLGSSAPVSDKYDNGFPSDWIDPSDKAKPQYALEYIRAAYEQYTKSQCGITSSRRNDFIENRMYAEGSQSTEKYKNFIKAGTDKDGKAYSYMNVDWSIVSTIPRVRDTVLGYFEKLDHDVAVTAIDKMSDDERNRAKFTLWAKKLLQPMLAEAGIKEQLGMQDEVLFDTMQELEMFMQMSSKLQTEIAMKQGLDFAFYTNRWPEIAKKLREDLFDLGIAATREYTTEGGKIKVRYVDPVNLIIRKTRNNECTESNYIGEVIEMTLADLASEAGDQFSMEDYKKMAKAYSGREGNPPMYSQDFVDTSSDFFRDGGAFNAKDFKIKVVDLSWFTVDEMVWEEKENAAGEKITYRKPFKYNVSRTEYLTKEKNGTTFYFRNKGGKLEEISKDAYLQGQNRKERVVKKSAVKMVYGGKWIVGTEFVYDYGKQYDMPRPKSNLRETFLPYHVYRLSNKSILERMIPFADGMQTSWLRIQNAKAKARPKGIKVEVDALENMVIGGKSFSPLELLAVYDATGNIIYKGTGTYGDPTRSSPVEELQGGMGGEYRELIQDLNFNIDMLYQVSGISEIFSAASPNPNMPVGTQKIAVTSTMNALQPMLSAYQSIFERTASSVALRLQILSKYGVELNGYSRALGETVWKIIELSADISLPEFGIKIEMRPTAEQREKVEGAALQAMNTRDESGQGQITYPDYIFVMRMLDGGNVKFAEAVLSQRITKRAQEKQQKALEMIQANSQAQQEAAMVAEQAKQQTQEAAHRLKMEEIMIKGEEERKTAQVVGMWRYETEKLVQTGKAHNTQQLADATINGKAIEGETQIKKEIMKGNREKSA